MDTKYIRLYNYFEEYIIAFESDYEKLKIYAIKNWMYIERLLRRFRPEGKDIIFRNSLSSFKSYALKNYQENKSQYINIFEHPEVSDDFNEFFKTFHILNHINLKYFRYNEHTIKIN